MSFKLRRLCNLIVALGVVLAAPSFAVADGFDGATWQVPTGLVLDDQWEIHCPAKCLIYEGREGYFEDEWPLLIVHEPSTDTPQPFFSRWKASEEKRNEEPVSLMEELRELAGDGHVTGMIAYLEPDKSYGSREAAFLMIYEYDDIILPVEIRAFDYEELSQRVDVATALLSSVQIDVAKARSRATEKRRTVSVGGTAISNGYKAGQRAELFLAKQSSLRNVYGLGGLQLQLDFDITVYILLPGGVLLTQLPDDMRAPELERMRTDDAVGSWKAEKGGYSLSLPNGRTVQAKLDRDGDLVVEGQIIPKIHRPSNKELAGKYGSADVHTTGGMAAGQNTMIASQAWSGLQLFADGRFTKSRDSYTAVSSTNVGGGVGSDSLVTGRWRYDTAACTLVLTPDDGSPEISGPSFCYGCDGGDYRGGNWDWIVLGEQDWWAEND